MPHTSRTRIAPASGRITRALGRATCAAGRACLLGFAICTILAASPMTARAADTDADSAARLAAIKAHVTDTVIVIPNNELKFEDAGPRLPIEDLPAGTTLVIAAYYYSLVTGDFAVSLADLMDHGFWPYDIYEPQYREQFVIEPGYIRSGILSSHPDDPEWLAAITTDSSIYAARCDILDDFYREYLAVNREHVDEALAALKPIDAFWQVDGLVKEDGEPAGKVEDAPVSRFLYMSVFSSRTPPANDPYDKVMVPILNYDYGTWPCGASNTSVSPNSGYDSQYREQTRSARKYQESATPAAPAAPAQ